MFFSMSLDAHYQIFHKQWAISFFKMPQLFLPHTYITNVDSSLGSTTIHKYIIYVCT
jgi:hypothetical protein